MIRTFCAAFFGMSLFAVSAATAQDIRIQTAQGEMTTASNPSNVVALDIAAIDTLSALGVSLAGVPDKVYVDYLGDLNAATVGTLFEPNMEAIANLTPDLIIAGGRSAAKVQPLSKIAPTLDMTIGEDTIADARVNIATYGALFGKQDEAAELKASLEVQLDTAKSAATGKGKALILMTNGPKVSAYGRGSRFGWIHTALDLPEAFENLNPEVHGDAVSFEFIAEVNPDWLIVVDRSVAIGEAASAHTTLDNPLVAGTTAAQKDQIIYLSAAPLYIAGGGYTSLSTTLAELTTAFSK
ncbi:MULTISPECIES: siderophore ABC transporter substrate-binding protein [Pacificibacter]|uniref:siderophore ABC transporter substrate-binding protein n=1 Tax=Pacificibacter TaxID=1042323 RepID=UPI001C08F07D|nr:MULTISPECIES: siderophore ABC transporter substrate-binding protein [Pacificibacter]MBU2936085.1 siderophore ABC transporter substrate-binding protein [Pacificibacter marinus]MDO6615066.1 siderophore ABC transporter substrate-binding protein [Pacificibacter sp. 1_MG-2023]